MLTTFLSFRFRGTEPPNFRPSVIQSSRNLRKCLHIRREVSSNHNSVIFVHGLKRDYEPQSKEWRESLRSFDVQKTSFHVFAFCAATLLQEGESTFTRLVKRLQDKTFQVWDEEVTML